MIETAPSKRTAWAVLLFYLFIGFEILYMISPFGIYYYSVYGSGLDWLNAHALTAWLCAFFLPHIATTSSWVLNVAKPVGWVLTLLGLVGFFVAAVPIYYGKLRSRGPVTGGVYRFVRHPQYSALMLCSFGLLLVWPRHIVMVAFVAVAFAYYFLARSEERECSAKFGKSFDEYVERTSMFFPFDAEIWKRLPSLPKAGLARAGAVVGYLVAAVVLGIALTHALRLWSVRSLYTAHTEDSAIVSLVPLDDPTMLKASGIARGDPKVTAAVQAAATATSQLLIYVLPAEWFESDIPMNMQGHQGHFEPRDWQRSRLKVLVMQAVVDDGDGPAGEELLLRIRHRKPIAEATVDLDTERVLAIDQPPESVRWGSIPTPIY
jgi:protein-S-isoprenylcysteine O-methyltransferase Ste14